MNKVLVYLDMDGVLVDWLNGVRVSYNYPPKVYDVFRRDPTLLTHDYIDNLFGGKEVLKKVQLARPVEWWLNLPFYPWADYLVKTINSNFEMAFLTSPGSTPTAAKAKIQWQLDHYPNIPIIIAKHKYLVASSNKVLIDDDIWQTSRFEKAGGLAIQWPNQFHWEGQNFNLVVKPYIQELVKQIKNYENTFIV